jgi:hypothetical protein
MKTDHTRWNPSTLVRAGWCTVFVFALHGPLAARADGLPDAASTPPAAACDGTAGSRTVCPQGAPVAPAVPETGSSGLRSPEQAPGRVSDGAIDLILCACLSIKDIPLHDAIVDWHRLRAHA